MEVIVAASIGAAALAAIIMGAVTFFVMSTFAARRLQKRLARRRLYGAVQTVNSMNRISAGVGRVADVVKVMKVRELSATCAAKITQVHPE